MSKRHLKIIAASLLTFILIAVGVAMYFINSATSDNYAGHPQVVGLPPGFDPLAATVPYAGAHPARKNRRADRYAYPIPVGEPGPVMPTHLDSLDYPFVCRTERSLLGQPLVDNQDGAGIAVYEDDEIVGYSKDCSVNTRVLYYYRSADDGKFLPLVDQTDNIEEININGETVPYIVRLEIGTINRHIYIIALLRGPNDTPEAPDLSLWNRKLLYQMRGGVGIGRRQARADPEPVDGAGGREMDRSVGGRDRLHSYTLHVRDTVGFRACRPRDRVLADRLAGPGGPVRVLH